MTTALTDTCPVRAAFELDNAEESYAVTDIDGKVPAFVRGAYYSNGPARFHNGNVHYRHWLDGDGMVCSLRFGDDDVRFANRFVRGRKFVREEDEGRAIYRCFGTAFEGDVLMRGVATESPYNVSVFRYGDRLLAFGEQSLPMELDPVTLESLGVFDFDRQLNEVSPFSAHPKIDSASGELLNFGVSFATDEPRLNVYRFGPNSKRRYRSTIPIDYPCSVHDFAASDQYIIFYLSPYLLDIAQLLREGVPTIDALHWRPERGSSLIVLSRETGEEVARLPVGSGYCLHTIHAFESGGRLCVDLIEFERPVYDQYQVVPELFNDVPRGRPVRFTLDTTNWKVVDKKEMAYTCAPDFPSIDPRCDNGPADDVWMLGISSTGQPGPKFFDRIVHGRWSESDVTDIYQPPEHEYPGGEPVFVPDPSDARSGAILCPFFDTHRLTSSVKVFDAFDLRSGPVATLHLRSPLRLGFHASFFPKESVHVT